MPNTFIGLDYGHKKIGVAVGQKITQTAQPLKVIPTAEFLPEFKKILAQYRPDAIILGLPLNMDDSEAPITEKVRVFAATLMQNFDLDIKFVDERLTTKEARWFIEERGLPADTQADAIAAALILESYLSSL